MRTYQSQITRHNRVIILDDLAQAIAAGRAYLYEQETDFAANAATKYSTRKVSRETGKVRNGTTSGATLAKQYHERGAEFELACGEIRKGVEGIDNAATLALAERIRAAVLEIEPSLAKQGGMIRADDGDEFLWELAEAGEEACFLAPAKQDDVAPTAGEGAYRVVINTDVAWCCKPADNAAVMTALLLTLMEWGQVELWIQQAWLGADAEGDGVTLFKIDMSGAVEPSALSFWIGSTNKDNPFSWAINRALGRKGNGVSKQCEIPCDLWLYGPWATLAGLDAKAAVMQDPDKLVKFAAEWIASTAVKMVRGEQAEVFGV